MLALGITSTQGSNSDYAWLYSVETWEALFRKLLIMKFDLL